MKLYQLIFSVLTLGLLSAQWVFAQSSEIYRDESEQMGQEEFKDIQGIRLEDSATLKAMVSQEGQYDNNIFLTHNNQKHDLISVTSPKFLLNVPVGIDARNLVQFMYGADIGDFSTYKSQNYVNQEALAKAIFNLPFGYLNFQNNFDDTNDRADTEFTSPTRRIDDLTQATLGVEMNRLSYELGYSHFLRDYDEKQFHSLDYSEDFISNTVYYQILPRTKALLEYDHSFITYPNDSTRDGDYDQVRGGFKGNITDKTSYTIKVGYQDRYYNNSINSGYEGFVSEIDIDTAFTERTSLDINYISTAVESIDAYNNYYDLNSIKVGLNEKILDHFTLQVFSQLDDRNYPDTDPTFNVKRHDMVLTNGVTLRYDIKDWSSVSIGYQYLDDIANISSNGYIDDLYSLEFDFKI